MRVESWVTVSLKLTGLYREQSFLLLLSILLCAPSSPSLAQPCNSVPVAIDDEAFHEGELMVIDVLANDMEPDGEALTVTVLSTTCGGMVSEDFGLVSLEPSAPTSEECTIAYQIADTQGASAVATISVRDTGLLFKDDFESGDTSAWEEVATR